MKISSVLLSYQPILISIFISTPRTQHTVHRLIAFFQSTRIVFMYPFRFSHFFPWKIYCFYCGAKNSFIWKAFSPGLISPRFLPRYKTKTDERLFSSPYDHQNKGDDGRSQNCIEWGEMEFQVLPFPSDCFLCNFFAINSFSLIEGRPFQGLSKRWIMIWKNWMIAPD